MSVKSFLVGLLFGASLVGVGVFAASEPPKIVGESGRLEGIEVTGMEGKRVCHNPWYHKANQIIACE